MAPSRRRGVAKASVAAAARRQWKVGDLVLAKVKGFPAWPATVSEPEKWGYTTDWKKVLVYFFGTKQIAFCNPGDVEEFTEEKKKTLLTKRQGKGADFVRAVQEIIDSYEKLKVHEPDNEDEGNSALEDTVNAGNSGGSSGNSGSKFQVQCPVVVHNSRLECLSASHHRPLEISAAMEIADHNDMEKTSEVPVENALPFDHRKKTSVDVTTFLKRKSGNTLLQSFVIQKKAAVRRSRSASKVDSSRFPNHFLPSIDSGMDIGDLVPNVACDDSARRNRRTRRSPGRSVLHDKLSPGHSSAFVSNDSSEDNNSEVVLTNSDTVSFNEASTLESSCKSELPDIVVDYLERDVQLSDRLHFRDETVVLKKKRKPNRKRVSHDAVQATSSPNKDFGLPSEIVSNSSDGPEKIHEQISRVDGDEHLPLVKRARVRMGKPPTEEKQHTDFMNIEEKSSQEAFMNQSPPASSTSVFTKNFHCSETKLEVKEVGTGSGCSNNSHCSETTLEVKEVGTGSGCANNSHCSETTLEVNEVGTGSGCANNSHCSETTLEVKEVGTGSSLPTSGCSNNLYCSETTMEVKEVGTGSSNLHCSETTLEVKEAGTGSNNLHCSETTLEVKEVGTGSNNVHCSEITLEVNEVGTGSSLPTSGCANNFHCSETTLEVKEVETGSLPNFSDHKENNPLFWKAKNYQVHCTTDGEAALPPSKRIHRALEAMSANAVEDGRAYTKAPRTPKAISSSGCSESAEKSLCHVSMDDKDRSVLDVEDVNSAGDNACADGAIGITPGLTLPTIGVEAITPSEVGPCDHLVGCSVDPKYDDLNTVIVKTSNFAGNKSIGVSSVSCSLGGAEISLRSPRLSPNSNMKQVYCESTLGSLNQDSPSEKGYKHNTAGQNSARTKSIPKVESAHSQEEKLGRDHGGTRPNHQGLDSVPETKDAALCSTLSGVDASLSVATGGSSKNKAILMSPPEENVKGMCENVTDVSSYSSSMKVLIAAAQAKRKLSRATSISDNVMIDKVFYDAVSSPLGHTVDSFEKASPQNTMRFHAPTGENKNYSLHNGSGSPGSILYKKTPHFEMDEERNMGSSSSHRQKSLGRWAVAEANAARKSFESMLGTLTRTKESIGRATRLAIDCAKYGIAGEVVEILVRNLESESSLHRRVDLFFLVDSITQCSRGQKGEFGEIYPSAVQSVLPRLLAAAAPPGNAARENRRQCLKVLRLWLERKTLPESIVRHHIRELDSMTEVSFSTGRSRRPSRMERALNDPIREMEGMLVDEYGSNASFHLAGFCMPRMLEDEDGSDADDRSFEAVTPEQVPVIPSEREETPTSAIAKHCHILEDVDGELEMEDVAPSYEVERGSAYDAAPVDTAQTSNCYVEYHIPRPFAPPLPEDHPPTPPPLPASPPPIAPPLSRTSVPPTASSMCNPYIEWADSNLYTSRHSMQKHLQPPVSQQPGALIGKSMMDTVHNYAPGYRDFANQTPMPCSSGSSGSTCSFPVLQPSMHTCAVPTDGASLRNQSCHVQPPPPTLSNQFSYVQADQDGHSWMEASSSSFTKRFQYGEDGHRETGFHSKERMEVTPFEIGERCKIAPSVHSGHVQSDNPEAIYIPPSHYGVPREPRLLNRGWSFPPRALNYRHPTPTRPPECPMAGANGAPSFWIPK